MPLLNLRLNVCTVTGVVYGPTVPFVLTAATSNEYRVNGSSSAAVYIMSIALCTSKLWSLRLVKVLYNRMLYLDISLFRLVQVTGAQAIVTIVSDLDITTRSVGGPDGTGNEFISWNCFLYYMFRLPAAMVITVKLTCPT